MSMLRVPRGGKVVEARVKVPVFNQPKENDPIGADRVIGVDTESLKDKNGQLQTVLTPYSSIWGNVSQQKPIPTDIDPIEIVLDFTMSKFAEVIDETKGFESVVLHRLGKGTRERLTPVLWVFYNLEYDLQRLFLSTSEFFRCIRQGRTDVFVTVGRYKLQVVNCNPTGSAPSFQIIVLDTRSRTACRIYGMDMWGYWKTGLDSTAKALGVGGKTGDIPKEWFDIPLDEWTPGMWERFTDYAGNDAGLTRGVYLATAELLGSFSTAVFNKQGLLPPSAPAAAARMAFALSSEKEWKRPPKAYEQLALDGYHGGYVAMLRRGYVENVTVIDLHSAYPSAMLLLPDPCRCSYAVIPPGHWKDIPAGYRKAGNFGFVRATFTIKDCLFPSISVNSKKYTLHQPGYYKNFAISLPELSALFDLGQIETAAVHAGFMIVGDSSTSFLRRFVEWFYEVKETSEKDSPMYLAAKLLMNALYGKLIEVHEPRIPAIENAPDLYERIALPPGKHKIAELAKDIAQLYIEKGTAELFKYSAKNLEYYVSNNPKVTWEQIPHLSVMELLQDQTCTTGAYFLPIHASLITAMTRAKIAIMLNCFNCFGGDTDSGFTHMQPGTEEWKAAEARANEYATRAGVGGVKDDPGLLGYGVEMVGGRGYVAGIKQYTLQADGYKAKLAHHAITDPPGDDKKERQAFCRGAVEKLATGLHVTYMTRKKPRRLRESLLKNDGQYGVFIQKVRTVTPKEDERLLYDKSDEHDCVHYKWKPIHLM